MMSSKTRTPTFDNREAISLFELERRQRHLEPGQGTISDDFPPLPASSPWSAANAIPDELPIDRRCDGDTVEHEGD
jgi:hypothetical protein